MANEPNPNPAPAPAPAAAPSPAAAPAPAPNPAPAPAPVPSDPAAPAPTADDPKTIVGGGADADNRGTAPADWPADWRQKGLTAAGVAADDKGALAMLERLGSPGDLVKKVLEQEKLIRSGQHKQALPKDATDEQKAAWRKDNGVPETPDKYDIALPDGLVIGENDKPIVDNILKAAHGVNLTNDQTKAVLAAYYAQEKEFLQNRSAEISTNKTQQDDELHKEWGE